MTLKSALLIGLSSLIAYKTYQHKDELLTIVKEGKDHKDKVQYDFNRIKADLDIINSETKKVQKISEDIAYRLRVFNSQTQPVFLQIKERMEKYQTPTE